MICTANLAKGRASRFRQDGTCVEGFAPVQSLTSVDACTLHGRPAGRLLWAHVERVRQYRHAPRVSRLRHESWNQPFGIAAAD